MPRLGRYAPGQVPPRDVATEPGVAAITDAELRAAIEHGDICAHYQPVISLADRRPLAVEALARWNHPDRGLVMPDRFIPHAERLGLIGVLGESILEQACSQVRQWRQQGLELAAAVNLSAHQIHDRRLSSKVEAILDRTRLDPSVLWLEITETALVDDLDVARAECWKVHELGAHLAIDDFGTGWGSLTYLCQFPVDALKIDRSFVGGMHARVNAAIVKSLITLCHELDLDVVAEGIETVEQRRMLLQFGCTEGQGYLFGRPGPADAVFEQLTGSTSAQVG